MKFIRTKFIRTINDCPETKILTDTLNRYNLTSKANILTTFSIGLTGIYLHFSRYTGQGTLWVSWDPNRIQINLLINTLTCPKEKLIPIALKEPKYEPFRSRYINAMVPTDRTIAREIAIARMEGKL